MNVQRSLHPQYHDEVPLSKAPNPQLLPRHRSINGCPLLQVCVHSVFTAMCALGWVKCRARIPSMGHHTWLYVTSLSLYIYIYIYIYIQYPPLILAPLINMTKGGCENKSTLFILFIFHSKNSKNSNLSLK